MAKKRKPSPRHRDLTQKTRKGLEIPIPARDRFFGDLDRTVRKRSKKSSGRETTSH